MQDLLHVISFRLATSTPLLLVSKSINAEVTRLLKNLRNLLASQIYLQRIKEPTQAFLDVASRSRFVISLGPAETLFLVKRLPDNMKPLVKEIAFTLQPWDDAGPLWGTLWSAGSVLTNTLCSELSNLRTIAMELPHSGSEQEFWTAAPLRHLHDLLQSRRIDKVLFPYSNGDDAETYVNHFGPRNDAEDPEEIPSWMRHTASYIATEQREFDIVDVPSWTRWMSEPRFWEKQRLARTVQITRWGDTKLGSKTWRHIVVVPNE